MDSNQIQSLENRLIEAMKTSNVQELDNLLADSLIFTAHNGMLYTKNDDLDAHRSGNIEIFSVEASEQHIMTEGNVAVVSVLMEISGSFFGSTEVGFYRFMRVWKSHPQGWQVIAAQSTQVVS